MSVWDRIVVALTGTQVAILGQRLSGKTTLLEYLATGATPAVSEQTVVPTKAPAFRNRVLNLNIRKGVDLPGAEGYYEAWREEFERANHVFYLFDAHALRTNPKYGDRVREDGKKLKEWGVGNRRVMLLGTHVDQDPLYQQVGAANYVDEILDHESVVGFITRAKVRRSAVGSLTSGSSVEVLLRQLLEH